MIMIIIIIIIIIMIALKGAIPDFFFFFFFFWLQFPQCAMNCFQFIQTHGQGTTVCKPCNTLRAYQVQHVVCHMVQTDSSTIQFDRVEIT